MSKDTEAPADGVDEGLRETFLSIGCDLDGHPQNHAHHCTGRPALTPEQLADAWARRVAATLHQKLRDALRAEAVEYERRALVLKGTTDAHLYARFAERLRALLATDRPAGDA